MRGIKPHLHQHIVKSLFVLTAAEDGNPAIPALLHPAKGQFQHAFESLPRVTLERKTNKISIPKQTPVLAGSRPDVRVPEGLIHRHVHDLALARASPANLPDAFHRIRRFERHVTDSALEGINTRNGGKFTN